MNARKAGQIGGRQKSPAKRLAARRNGALGGRPKKADVFLRNMRALYKKLHDKCPHIDPEDLILIVERMCRLPGSGRRFFIRSLESGGYGV
jgi:hypothetical protein